MARVWNFSIAVVTFDELKASLHVKRLCRNISRVCIKREEKSELTYFWALWIYSS